MSVLRKALPEKLVVLTFDDGSISQLRNAAPLLKQLGFGATFFITEVRTACVHALYSCRRGP
eukprot:COSAG02_NODE_980_length_15492_cov_12.941727_8_plen_62_part_00